MKLPQQLRRRLDVLAERSTPHQGQLLLFAVIIMALVISGNRTTAAARAVREFARTHGQRNTEPKTVLSFLPDQVLLDEGMIQICSWLFTIAALLWLAQVLLPWSAWLSATAFTALLSSHWENSVGLSHNLHAVNMVLIVLALWYGLEYREIGAALIAGRFWSTPLCPRWVQALCVFYLGVQYGAAALTKLFVSGFNWVNGVTLQLWILDSGQDNLLTQLILNDRRLAQALQFLTLATELAALFAIFSRRLRTLVGLVLITFHLGSIFLLNVRFLGNLLLLILVFLPAKEGIEWFVSRRMAAGTPIVICYPDSFFGRLRAAIRSRLDGWGRWQPQFVPLLSEREISSPSGERNSLW
jgi:hypothetical protein